MRHTRIYHDTWFDAEGLKSISRFFETRLIGDFHKRYEVKGFFLDRWGEETEYASEESFLAAYQPGLTHATYRKTFLDYELIIRVAGPDTQVSLKGRTRKELEPVFAFVETLIPERNVYQGDRGPKRGRVYLVHWQGNHWRLIARYLSERHHWVVRPVSRRECRRRNTLEALALRALQEKAAVLLVFNGGREGAEAGLSPRKAQYDVEMLLSAFAASRPVVVGEQGTLVQLGRVDVPELIYPSGEPRQVFWRLAQLLRQHFESAPNPALSQTGPMGGP